MEIFYNICKGNEVTVIEESFVHSMQEDKITKEHFTKILTTKDLSFKEAEKVGRIKCIKLKSEFIDTLPKNDNNKFIVFLREGWYLFSPSYNVNKSTV